jgi:hypothetical protein
MKYLNDNYKELCPGVYVWENFLSAEEIIPVMKEIDSHQWEENYHIHDLKSFSQYKNRLLESLHMPEAELLDFDHIVVRHKTMGFTPHVDILNYANIIHDNEVDKNLELEQRAIRQPRFGFILYFNDDYEGGEICYPEFDFCYKPNAGDLVMHDIQSVHAVKKVISGHRYTHAAQVNDNYYLTPEIYNLISWPDKPFNLEDSRFHYTIAHGPSDNKRLKKFMESYVEEGLYS